MLLETPQEVFGAMLWLPSVPFALGATPPDLVTQPEISQWKCLRQQASSAI